MTKQDLKAFLIQAFENWGMPLAIRTDNGSPLGAPSRRVIPLASLWLAAWGVRHILNRPKMPTDNPNVENNQATSARWAELHTCENLLEVAAKLEEAALYQRDHFKVSRLKNITRRALYDRLYNNPKSFKQVKFDPQKAYQLLAKAIYPRKVSANGVITIYNQPFSVGAKYKRTIVFVIFDPQKQQWICLNRDKQIINVLSDDRFSQDNLYNLELCQ